jgi:hypothetical protein
MLDKFKDYSVDDFCFYLVGPNYKNLSTDKKNKIRETAQRKYDWVNQEEGESTLTYITDRIKKGADYITAQLKMGKTMKELEPATKLLYTLLADKKAFMNFDWSLWDYKRPFTYADLKQLTGGAK